MCKKQHHGTSISFSKSPSTYGALPDCPVTVHVTSPIYQPINNFDINVSQPVLTKLINFCFKHRAGQQHISNIQFKYTKLDGLMQEVPSFTDLKR